MIFCCDGGCGLLFCGCMVQGVLPAVVGAAERAALLSDCKVSKFGRIVQFYLCFFFLQWLCTVCGEGMGHTKTPDPYVLHRGGAFIVGQGKTLSY